ncbi:Hypp1050 [Branchiostoma lanceolatum]|uniref:Hypp1050 protein n=1 Tax=Branchiostoma lanceolatum TaxID=7740 RepID=A0A8J9ZEI3_BRALA|nr:Hypp1050 [Branchiostoma lanceolatum]
MDTTKPEHYSQNSSIQYSLGVEVLQQYMKWEECDTVLDAGCGTGEICKYISQQPEVASVVGFDASPDFVSYAMASQHNSSPNVLYHVANVSDASTLKPEWQGALFQQGSLFLGATLGPGQGCSTESAPFLSEAWWRNLDDLLP